MLIAVGVVALLSGMPVNAGTTATDSIPSYDGPHLKLCTTDIDLGLLEPDVVSAGKLEFINDGNAPLVIYDMFANCGCTVADYPREEIAPGGKGTITVKFNSRGRNPGTFRKTVRIRSNAVNTHEFFRVTGKVKRKYHQ